MTSSTSPSSSISAQVLARRTVRPRTARPGFTLMEMLVVLGIILALMALLLPAVGRAWRQGVRTRMALDLQVISSALEAYKQDHNDYPRYTKVDTAAGYDLGATLLGQALIGPGSQDQDGQNGPGWRTAKWVNGVPQSKVWGPYIQPDRFALDVQIAADGTATGSMAILDRYKHPILYYPANKYAQITASNGYAYEDTQALTSGKPSTTLYNTAYNLADMPTTTLQVLLGDLNHNGKIDNGETPVWTGPYLLWSRGPDEKIGPNDPTIPVSTKNRCDDVANFPRSEYQ